MQETVDEPVAAPTWQFTLGLVGGLVVQFVAAAVFLGLVAIRPGGCDSSLGSAYALTIALALDLALVAGSLFVLDRRRGVTRGALLGWGVSLIPTLVAVVLALSYVNSLPSGCG